MRATRSCAAEFAIVIAVMAIGAEDLRTHLAPLAHTIQLQHS